MPGLPKDAKTGTKKEITTGDGRKITAVKTDKGWSYSAPYGPKKGKGGSRGSGTPEAARAVVAAVGKLGDKVKDGVKSISPGNNRPATSPSSGGSSGGSPSPSPSGSAAPKPSKPKPPGKVYRKTRAAWKSEKGNQPRGYEPPEQRAERTSKSQFDMSMTGDEVKAARKAYLKSHPAAAKAVAKGTMSMGDINMTVRRLRKKNPGAIGMKTEDV
jgi:hypothetical protein